MLSHASCWLLHGSSGISAAYRRTSLAALGGSLFVSHVSTVAQVAKQTQGLAAGAHARARRWRRLCLLRPGLQQRRYDLAHGHNMGSSARSMPTSLTTHVVWSTVAHEPRRANQVGSTMRTLLWANAGAPRPDDPGASPGQYGADSHPQPLSAPPGQRGADSLPQPLSAPHTPPLPLAPTGPLSNAVTKTSSRQRPIKRRHRPLRLRRISRPSGGAGSPPSQRSSPPSKTTAATPTAAAAMPVALTTAAARSRRTTP